MRKTATARTRNSQLKPYAGKQWNGTEVGSRNLAGTQRQWRYREGNSTMNRGGGSSIHELKPTFCHKNYTTFTHVLYPVLLTDGREKWKSTNSTGRGLCFFQSDLSGKHKVLHRTASQPPPGFVRDQQLLMSEVTAIFSEQLGYTSETHQRTCPGEFFTSIWRHMLKCANCQNPFNTQLFRKGFSTRKDMQRAV